MEFQRKKEASNISNIKKVGMNIKYTVKREEKVSEAKKEITLNDIYKTDKKNIRVEYYPLAFGEKLGGVLGRATVIFANGITIRNIIIKKSGPSVVDIQLPQSKMQNGALEDIISITEELRDMINLEILKSMSYA